MSVTVNLQRSFAFRQRLRQHMYSKYSKYVPRNLLQAVVYCRTVWNVTYIGVMETCVLLMCHIAKVT